eukprot:1360200-Amorphochlora_amoeboformis.AAC.1
MSLWMTSTESLYVTTFVIVGDSQCQLPAKRQTFSTGTYPGWRERLGGRGRFRGDIGKRREKFLMPYTVVLPLVGYRTKDMLRPLVLKNQSD